MNTNEILDYVAECSEDAIRLDGLDDAIIGIATRQNIGAVLAYDKFKIIEIFVKRDGMSYEEAEEYFWGNTHGSWLGEGTPIFVELMRDVDPMKNIKVLIQ